MPEIYAARFNPEIPDGVPAKKIIWPFFYWKVLVPECEMKDSPNVFEQLYLSLQALEPKVDLKRIFKRLGIDDDLFQNIAASCHENNLSAEDVKRRQQRCAEIYLFRDGVTGTIIPELTIRTLPREYRITVGGNCLDPLRYDKRFQESPSIFDLEQLLQTFRRYHHFMQDNPEAAYWDKPFWQETLAGDDETSLEEPQDNASQNRTAQIDVDVPKAIQLSNQYAECINIELYLYADPYQPGNLHLAIPFPNVPRVFFDQILTISSKELQETLELARVMMEFPAESSSEAVEVASVSLSVATSYDKDEPILTRAFVSNELPIEDSVEDKTDKTETTKYKELFQSTSLFDRYSDIFALGFYGSLKREFKELSEDIRGLVERHERITTQFYVDCGKVFEALARYLIQSIPREERRESRKVIQISAFALQVDEVLQKLGQTGCEDLIHVNANDVRLAIMGKKNGNAKDLLIGLAIDAVAQNRASQDVFRANPTLIQEFFMIYNLRNNNSHHVSDEEECQKKEVEATHIYERLMYLSDVLIGAYLQSKNNEVG